MTICGVNGDAEVQGEFAHARHEAVPLVVVTNCLKSVGLSLGEVHSKVLAMHRPTTPYRDGPNAAWHRRARPSRSRPKLALLSV